MDKAHQAPLSKGFSRQEYWSRLPFLPPRDLPDLGIGPTLPEIPALPGGFFFFFNHCITWEAPLKDKKSHDHLNKHRKSIWWNGHPFYIYTIEYYSAIKGFPVAQMENNLPAMRKTRVLSLGWEDPLEKEMATHSNILARRILWTEKPGGLQSTGSQRVRHDWATDTHTAVKKKKKRRNACATTWTDLETVTLREVSQRR